MEIPLREDNPYFNATSILYEWPIFDIPAKNKNPQNP